LDLLILKVVALGPVHGYAIAQRLDQVSRGEVQVPQGSLYPALHRLENRGFPAADWKAKPGEGQVLSPGAGRAETTRNQKPELAAID
jgi:DNA-binding PadR family transcriptional regulator